MQKIQTLVILVIVFSFFACSSSKKDTGNGKQKTQGPSFRKIFIVANTADIKLRVSLENELSARAVSGGYTVIKSLDVIPFLLEKPNLPTKEEVNRKARENACDAVLITYISHQEESVTLVKGTTVNANEQFLVGILGGIVNKKNTISAPPIQAVNIPSSYSHEEAYFIIQSFLYDVATETIAYSGQTNPFQISSLDKMQKDYAISVMTQLEKEHLLKK